MQKEDPNPFVDPFRSQVDPSPYTISMSDSAESPWPRRIVEDKTEAAGNLLGSDFSPEFARFGLDAGCKWLQLPDGCQQAIIDHLKNYLSLPQCKPSFPRDLEESITQNISASEPEVSQVTTVLFMSHFRGLLRGFPKGNF
ncbi:hypothetical protein X801_08463, partial [Opisthorchis viverrini]